jgi:hypothetical protein
LYSVRKNMARKINMKDVYSHQQKTEKILLLNTGLNAAYIFGGLYLNERGKRTNNVQSQGFGSSLLLQGGFLLVFDMVQYSLHRKQGKLLDNWFKNAQLGVTNNGIGLVYKL